MFARLILEMHSALNEDDPEDPEIKRDITNIYPKIRKTAIDNLDWLVSKRKLRQWGYLKKRKPENDVPSNG